MLFNLCLVFVHNIKYKDTIESSSLEREAEPSSLAFDYFLRFY